MTVREMQDEILRIKKEKDICILAHAYQRQDILDVADFICIESDGGKSASKHCSYVRSTLYG